MTPSATSCIDNAYGDRNLVCSCVGHGGVSGVSLKKTDNRSP